MMSTWVDGSTMVPFTASERLKVKFGKVPIPPLATVVERHPDRLEGLARDEGEGAALRLEEVVATPAARAWRSSP